MKKMLICLFTLLFFVPINVFGLSSDYDDVTSSVVGVKKEEDKINLYLFYSYSCPHCHEEIKYLESDFQEKYKDKVNVYKFEVAKNKDNSSMMMSVKALFDLTSPSVPFTVIGNEYILGYGDGTSDDIEQVVDKYLNNTKDEKIEKTIPILGKVDAKKASLSLIAVILGLIDGFNPCAMWILLLLINMCLSVNDRKKMFTIGLTFILTSGFIYFLSMLGISFVIDFAMVNVIRDLIALVAIILGIYNLYTWYKTRKDTGCHVVDKKKRKNIISRINNIMSKKSFILGVFGTIILAASVNLVELACSLGFPTIFIELLSINNIVGVQRILLLVLYIFFYLVDDLVIFLIALFTLKSTGISTKYNKYVNFIGGILMIIMGLLLIFKPEWIMFNF